MVAHVRPRCADHIVRAPNKIMEKIYISRISDGFTGKGNTIVRVSTNTSTSKQTITMSVTDLERLRNEIDLYIKKAWS